MIVAHDPKLPMAVVAIPPYTRAVLCGALFRDDGEGAEDSPMVEHFVPLALDGVPVVFALPFPQGDPTDCEDVYQALLDLLPHAAERYRALGDLADMQQTSDIRPEQITGEEPPRR